MSRFQIVDQIIMTYLRNIVFVNWQQWSSKGKDAGEKTYI